MDSFQLIQQLIGELDMLPYLDAGKLDELRRRTKMYIRKIFGDTSSYIREVDEIRFIATEDISVSIQNLWDRSGAKLMETFYHHTTHYEPRHTG